jgi:hypothetical protein
MSPPSAILADSLTRKSSISKEKLDNIQGAIPYQIPTELSLWSENPSEDWELPARLQQSVKNNLSVQ